VCGPSAAPLFTGAKYFCPVVDDATCFAVIGFLKKKSDTPKFFSKYAKMMELQRKSSIKAVCRDNGGEFTGTPFKEFCSEKGIVQEFTASYSPWQDGVSEHKIQTILHLARCILCRANLPPRFGHLRWRSLCGCQTMSPPRPSTLNPHSRPGTVPKLTCQACAHLDALLRLSSRHTHRNLVLGPNSVSTWGQLCMEWVTSFGTHPQIN